MVVKIINENIIENKNEDIINFNYFDYIMFRYENMNTYALTAENLAVIHHAANENRYEY